VLAALGVIVLLILGRRRRRQAGVIVLDPNQREEYRTEVNLGGPEGQRLYNFTEYSAYPTIPAAWVEDSYSATGTAATPHQSGRYTGAAEL
jgi:hypothetical protein